MNYVEYLKNRLDALQKGIEEDNADYASTMLHRDRRRLDEIDSIRYFLREQNNLQTTLIATERALWLARAKNASYNIKNRQRVINTELEQERPDIEFIHHHEKMKQKWMNVERLCLKKAEEYK